MARDADTGKYHYTARQSWLKAWRCATTEHLQQNFLSDISFWLQPCHDTALLIVEWGACRICLGDVYQLLWMGYMNQSSS